MPGRKAENNPGNYQADIWGTELQQPHTPQRRRGKWTQQRLFSGEDMRIPFPETPVNKIPDRLGMTTDPGTLFSRPEPEPQGTQAALFATSEDAAITVQIQRQEHLQQEARKEASLDFEEYHAWKEGYPTWSVYTVYSSYSETYDLLQRLVSHEPGGWGNVRRAVIGTVDSWKTGGKPSMHDEAAKTLVQDFVMNGVRRVEWTPVYDTLRGEREALPDQANPLTALAYELLSQTDWQAIVKGAAYLSQADEMLRGWLEDQCLTWIESVDARRYQGAAGTFANKVLAIYFRSVNWHHVRDAFRGE